jgi:hypothetical protein
MAYQAGDRVALVHTSDPCTLLTPGTAGAVTGYDERLGQLDMAWDDCGNRRTPPQRPGVARR